MTENGIILNNEMADFSIPGVTKVGWDGPPKVSQNVCYILCIIPPLQGNDGHSKSNHTYKNILARLFTE